MQTNIERFFEEGNGIKVNPLLKTLRTTRPILLLSVIIWLVLFLFITLASVWASHPLEYRVLLLYAFIVATNIGNIAMNMAQERYWKRIEQRRFAIIQGDQTAFVDEQPGPHVASMQLSLTIKMRYTKEFVFLLTGIILLVALYIAGTFSWIGPWFLTSNALLFFLVVFFLSAALFIALIFFLLFSRAGRQQVEVTETGITTWYGGKVATVRWEEARLLAMYNAFGAQKSEAAITYELSSARNIVRWTWIRHKTFFIGREPTVPLDEHNRQMQELLTVVQAKTGLSLYDLRY
jgi:ABC-type multidrug transport system fused ATPase/permease subunit